MLSGDVTLSQLPSFFLPCAQCGNRMEITAVVPARHANGAASNDLVDVINTCVQCGSALVSTRRAVSAAA